MSGTELKSCPYCGGDDICIEEQEEYHSHGRFFLYCGDCYASGPLRKDSKKAIEAWNRRADNGRIK